MADFQNLTAEIADLRAQVEATKGVEASAVALINGFAAAVEAKVTAALQANDAADSTSIDDARAAIAAVRSEFATSGAALGEAVAANQQ